MEKIKSCELSIIHEAIKEYFDCDSMDIFQRSRKKELLPLRQWFQFFSWELNRGYGGITLKKIGMYYYDITNIKFDHATVLNSHKTIKGYVETSKEDKYIYECILEIIKIKMFQESPLLENIGLGNPTNQHQQVLWYLINWNKPFSLANIIYDSMFYKFQSRLGEIEREHGIISKKEKQTFINKFNRKSNYVTYKAIDKEKCLNLYELYN